MLKRIDSSLPQGLAPAAGSCCLYIVREYYGAKTANKVARIMVIPPHREGGQAQFIEQPMAVSTQDAQVNRLLDYLRENLTQQHTVDELATRTAMSRRTFTRHFSKAIGMTLVSCGRSGYSEPASCSKRHRCRWREFLILWGSKRPCHFGSTSGSAFKSARETGAAHLVKVKLVLLSGASAKSMR